MSQEKPDFRLDHTMIRVFDQDKTLDFHAQDAGVKIHCLVLVEHANHRVVETKV